MKKLAIAAVLAGAFGLAAPAVAGPGQCYDHYGRPVGPVYDTDHPNYGFITSVIRNGGSCTGVPPGYNSNQRRTYQYDSPRYDYDRQRRRQRDDARRHDQKPQPKQWQPGVMPRPNDSR